MSDNIYHDVISESKGMKTDREEMTVVVYESAYCVRDHEFRTETNTHQPLQRRGSDSVRNRSFRAAAVCLGLLCVLLLTAVIVLCVTFTQERQQLISKNENLTNERNQLRNNLQSYGRWAYYKSSFYYMPNETKSWTKSRRYCTERGADLIIINNREEQDFVKKMFGGTSVYIGLTDSVVEGTWKWVDGSTLTSGLWGAGEPNGRTAENCVVIVDHDQRWPTLFGLHDVACIKDFQWICEKSISQLTQP